MIIRLFCSKCAREVSKKLRGHASIDVPMPVSRLSDNGEYEVICEKGHKSIVVLDNLKFELLFEMGLNLLIDSYPREAVTSFVSSLERFYEFYWRVVMNNGSISDEAAVAAWKPLSKLSERQLGAYVSASLILTKSPPSLLDPNKEVQFRNNVIHNGYVPTKQEAISFGDSVMGLINTEIGKLRELSPVALLATYDNLSPKAKYPDSKDEQENPDERGFVNMLTAIDVRHSPKEDDKRVGGVEAQFQRILEERQPYKIELFANEEMRRRYLDQT